MSQVCKSEVFTRCWREKMTAITQARPNPLTISEIVPLVWTPVFTQCVCLLEQLMNYSISLPMVDCYFKGMERSIIALSIKQLQRGVEICRSGKDKKNFKWIEGVVNRMEQFWRLCLFSDAAQTFLNLRDTLNLSGNFQLVERVADKVRMLYSVTTGIPVLPQHPGCQLHEGSNSEGH